MKKLFMSAVALLFAGALWAQENPLWMRHCAISPDGTTIAKIRFAIFAFKHY